MLSQVELLECIAFKPTAVTAVTAVLKQRQEKLKKPQSFNKIFLCSGHVIDAPNRDAPRFPPEKEGVVKEKIAEKLKEWNIGPNDLAICGAARGADILFAELCAAQGAEVWLFLALDEGEYLEESVRLPNSNWEERFYSLRAQEGVKTFFQHERLGTPPRSTDRFARTNLWMINTALSEAKSLDKLHAILIWDELPTGDGPGGTSDFATRVKKLGGRLDIINPTKLTIA